MKGAVGHIQNRCCNATVSSLMCSCSFCSRTIVALVYNVLKTLMEMNGKLFDELTSSYKAERQRYFPFL